MKRLCIVLIGVVLPLQLGASAQQRKPQLAYDFCGPFYGESGAEILCDVRLSAGDSNLVWLMWGARPEWSADGLRLAVAGDNLAIYNLVNGSTTFFPGTGWVAGPPRWSPDSTRIAFASERDGVRELYVINADGSGLTRLTDQVGFTGAYAWSPNGATIAFDATVGGVSELFVMQPDGSQKTRLTYGVGFTTIYESAPSWSANGARIAFDCANTICSIHADGTNFARLTTDPAWAAMAVFSPIDARVAFVTSRFGGYELAILEENGAVTRVAPGLWATQPAWSPGADSLAFVNVRGPFEGPADNSWAPGMYDMVYKVNPDGSALTPVSQGHRPRWATAVSGQPAAIFTHSCSGATCQFDATGSFDPNGSITSYHWNFGDGTTGSGATVAHQYATGTQYNVTLTVTDNTGAKDVSLWNVSANAPPVASFTVTCSGPTCTFNGSAADPDGTIASYAWIFGDGSYLTAAGATAAHVYANGTFLPKLQVRDNGGAVVTVELATPVTIVNATPVAAFTVVCDALRCTFDASPSADDDVIHQNYWEFGDGQSLYSKVWTHTYQTAGVYQVRLTVVDTVNQRTTLTKAVTVIAPPPPPIVQMHVGNLTGSSTSAQKTWNAFVTVQIHGDTHQGTAGVAVSGRWSDGSTTSCQTDASGSCVLTRQGFLTKVNAATLNITGLAFGAHVYQPSANHDVDGGSNGTSIIVKRR